MRLLHIASCTLPSRLTACRRYIARWQHGKCDSGKVPTNSICHSLHWTLVTSSDLALSILHSLSANTTLGQLAAYTH